MAERKTLAGVLALAGGPNAPSFIPEKTIAREITFSGLGVHSGRDVAVRVLPAPAGHGIRFVRKDLAAACGREIHAGLEGVISTDRSTTLGLTGGRCECSVRTVEHLMAAFAAAGVTNALVEVDGPEVPILDGSAAAFYQGLTGAGTVEQGGARPVIRVGEPVVVRAAPAQGGAGQWMCALPWDGGLRVTFTFVSSRPGLGHQVADVVVWADGEGPSCPLIDREAFAQASWEGEIPLWLAARTVAFREEIEALMSRGLALGAAHSRLAESAVVVGPEGIEGAVRMPDEIAHHKVLDIVGDLALLPGILMGHVVGFMSSHALNIQLGRAILERFWR